ncbi:MAG TPA: AAA family ATPase [Acidimicrobiia bacterium]
MPRHILTGAPGTGKTTVLELLATRYVTVTEPAREVIAEHMAATGETTLDHRPESFVEKLIERSLRDYESASDTEITLFDRGLPDCAAYAAIFGLDEAPTLEIASKYRYESPVFMTRPWRAIYTTDEMRRATYQQVEAFHEILRQVYLRLDYEIAEVPQISPGGRAAFIEERLGQVSGG